LACKFVSETDIAFVLVVKVAEALTGPLVIAPVGVTKVVVAALAGDSVNSERDSTAALIAPALRKGFFCIFYSER
jgi:hypothetical protein